MEEELSPTILAARARLRARCAKSQQLGGKGTARRKIPKAHKNVIGEDKKLSLVLKRLGVSPIFGVEEIFFIKEDGKALHILNPKVQAAPAANTYVVAGAAEEKGNAAAVMGLRGAMGGAAAAAAAAAANAGEGGAPAAINPEMLRQLQQHVESLSKKEKGGDSSNHNNSNGAAAAAVAAAAAAAAAAEEEEDVPDLVQNFEEASKE